MICEMILGAGDPEICGDVFKGLSFLDFELLCRQISRIRDQKSGTYSTW